MLTKLLSLKVLYPKKKTVKKITPYLEVTLLVSYSFSQNTNIPKHPIKLNANMQSFTFPAIF